MLTMQNNSARSSTSYEKYGTQNTDNQFQQRSYPLGTLLRPSNKVSKLYVLVNWKQVDAWNHEAILLPFGPGPAVPVKWEDLLVAYVKVSP